MRDFGFDSTARLTGKNRFGPVFRARRVRTNPWFLVHYAPAVKSSGQSPAIARLGVVVSRKVHRSAVERNRIRRQIRESFRLKRGQLKVNDYVVRARPSAAQLDNAALRKALDELWEWFKRE